jgi:hypothetical protein
MSLRIDAENSLTVLKQGCRRVAKILVLFTIYDDLVGGSVIEIESQRFRREDERGEKKRQSNKVHELGRGTILWKYFACEKV